MYQTDGRATADGRAPSIGILSAIALARSPMADLEMSPVILIIEQIRISN
jgi:hypothetical protein